jgi:signal recognition particle subunit SEC65
MTKEALKIALEALEADPAEMVEDENGHMVFRRIQAIITLREALANEALEKMAENARELGLDYEPEQTEHGWTPERIAGMARLKEAQDKKLAQQEQPKARTGNCLRVGVCASEGHKIAPQRTWTGLTDEEVKNFVQAVWPREATPTDYIRAIEAKLKEKNNG